MTKSSNVYRGFSDIVLPCRNSLSGGAARSLHHGGGRGGGEHVDREELVGPGCGVDDQLDGERDAGEGLDRVGEQPEVAGPDALDRDRARDPEDHRVLGEIERVDAREPGVPGRLGQLRPHRGCDLGPQIIRCWSAHATAPPGCPQAYPQVWRSSRVVRPPTPRPLPNRGLRGSSRRPGPAGTLGSRTLPAPPRTPQAPAMGVVHTVHGRKTHRRGGIPNAPGGSDRIVSPGRKAVHCTVAPPAVGHVIARV